MHTKSGCHLIKQSLMKSHIIFIKWKNEFSCCVFWTISIERVEVKRWYIAIVATLINGRTARVWFVSFRWGDDIIIVKNAMAIYLSTTGIIKHCHGISIMAVNTTTACERAR